MHDFLKPFTLSPSQKFHKNLNNFEESQKFSKTPKFRSKDTKCMIKRGIKDLTSEEEQDQGRKNLGMKFGVREKSLGGEKAERNRERSKRMDLKSRGAYI